MIPTLGGIDVLIVCTGNICRSPMAELMLRAHLGERGMDARVHSAGLLHAGAPAADPAVTELGTRRLDLSSHRSRRLARELVAGADLVVGMERRHVREAVELDPSAWPKAFTLKDVVCRGEAAGGRQDGEDVAAWLERIGAGRSRDDLAGAPPDDTVADPIGQPASVYRACADELDDLCRRLSALLAP